MDKRVYWVWAQKAFGAGSMKPCKLLRRFSSLQKFYEQGPSFWNQFSYLTAKEKLVLQTYSLDDAQALIHYAESLGQAVVTPDDSVYPEALRNISNPPSVLYVKGALPDVDHFPAIAVVGTRKATENGLHSAFYLSSELAKHDAIIVSGGAMGIDRAAHEGAIHANGKTICVLGCGIDYPYLMQNSRLRCQISESGALVSEYPPNTGVFKANFPIRNRIISGLSCATLVVEAAKKSGSLITAQIALEQSRDVFAVPGNIWNKNSEGVNSLIQLGAKPVTCANDILEEYSFRFSDTLSFEDSKPSSESPLSESNLLNSNIALSDSAKAVYEVLNFSPCHITEISSKTGLSFSQIFSAITELEILGKIQSLPGRMYSLPQ